MPITHFQIDLRDQQGETKIKVVYTPAYWKLIGASIRGNIILISDRNSGQEHINMPTWNYAKINIRQN